MASFKERVEQHDREIAAIRKLLMMGAKTLVKHDREMMELKKEMRALEKQVSALTTNVDSFIRSLRGTPGNGHAKRRIE